MIKANFITADAPFAKHVKAIFTTNYADFSINNVANRTKLSKDLNVNIAWLNQMHGIDVVEANVHLLQSADAHYTKSTNTACAILTADCLPVLLSDIKGEVVSAVHAGWRSLASGILQKTVEQMETRNSEIIAYAAPSIANCCFEVGSEVFEQFCQIESAYEIAFKPLGKGKFLADLVKIAKIQLQIIGVLGFYSSDICTMCDDRFFSHRQNKSIGRQASLIWIER